MVVVEFDGMGPTWSKLVEVGIERYTNFIRRMFQPLSPAANFSTVRYPNASHGIIADADFAPMLSTLDKSYFLVLFPI